MGHTCAMAVPRRSTRWVLGWLALAAAVAAAAAAGAPWAGAQDTDDGTPACRTSVPDVSRPPGGGSKLPSNGHLWAAISANGRIVARPRGTAGMPRLNKDGSITTKWLWLGRLSSKTRKRRLTLTGKRLDGEGEPFRVVRSGGWNGRHLYWPGYLTFSAPGCWKVAGTAGAGTRLMLVISVEPPPEDR